MQRSPPDILQQTFRPPWVSMTFAGVCACVTPWLYEQYQQGQSWGLILAAGAVVIGIRQFIQALDDYGKLRRYRRRKKQFEEAAKKVAGAAFATAKEIATAGMFGTAGLFCGSIDVGYGRRRDVRYAQEGSGIVLSPPGGGKSAACFIPTLLTDPSTHIVNDPTLELFACTHEQRRRMNNDVILLCPWMDEVAKILGPKVMEQWNIEDSGLNFWSTVDFEGQPGTIREMIKNRVELLLPDNPNTDAKTRFFERDGRALLEFVCLWLLHCGARLTWPNVRQLLLSGPSALGDIFLQAMETSSFAGELALLGNGLNGTLTASPAQFAGGFGSAAQAVELLDGYSPVCLHVSRPGFDPKRLTSGKNVTVYMCYPGAYAKTHQRLLSANYSYLFQQVCKGINENSVTALIDEAAEVGFCPWARYMNTGRKYNLRLFLGLQDAEGQLLETFGEAGVSQIFAAAHCLWMASLRGNKTCEMVSKMLGTKVVESPNLSDRLQDFTPLPDQTRGRSTQEVPLLRPHEAQQLPQDKVLVSVGANKPFLLDKVFAYQRPDLRRKMGKNPYRGDK